MRVLISFSWVRGLSLSANAVLLVLALGFAFGLKFSLVQDQITLSGDPANYLITMNGVFGGDETGLGLARPPLIAIPMKVFTTLFGVLSGIKVLGVLAAVSIGIPFYLLARRFSSEYIAVMTTLLFVFSSPYSDMIAWGFLTFFGLFFILLTIHLVLRLLERPTKLNIALTGVSASLLVGFHQVSAVTCLLLVGAFLILYMATNPGKITASLKALALAGLVCGILSLVYLPSYLLANSELTPGSPGTSLIALNSFQQAKDELVRFFPDTPLAILLLITATGGMALLWPRDRNTCLLLAVLFFVPVLAIFISFDSPAALPVMRRLPYFMYIPLWLFTGVTLSRLLSGDDLPFPGAILRFTWVGSAALAGASVIAGAFLALEIPASQSRLHDALSFYAYVDEPVWNGINWIQDNTEPDDIFVVYPKLFGWWIEGAGQRNAFETRDLAAFYHPQREEGLIANLVLSGNQGLENGNLRIATTDPFVGGPGGNPTIGVFAEDQYRDVMLIHDQHNLFQIQEGGKIREISLSSSTEKDSLVRPEADGLVMETKYSMDGFEVIRSIGLNRGEGGADVIYYIQRNRRDIKRFTVLLDLNLGQNVRWEQTGPSSFQKSQTMKSPFGLYDIVTHTVIETSGAMLDLGPSPQWGDHFLATFELQRSEATLKFRFETISPLTHSDQPVGHFFVRELLEDNSIDYIAVDTETDSALFNDMPWRTVGWLEEYPYLDLVFEEGRVQIYKVNHFPWPVGLEFLPTGPAPIWWPAEGVTPYNALGVVLLEPAAQESDGEASYYRLWYQLARQSLASVLGYQEGTQDADLAQKTLTASSQELWREVSLLQEARQSGVVGHPDFPGYHYHLWLAFGQPKSWPPTTLGCSVATSITPPAPPQGISSDLLKSWYICNRAKLAVVYYGNEDRDPLTHSSYAQQLDDDALHSEIMQMREALADGVMGSPDRPFEAFENWGRAGSQ